MLLATPTSHPMRTGLGRLLATLTAAIVVPVHLAAEEPDLAAALREQQALLGQVEDATQPGEFAGSEAAETNPRSAPRTPIPRDLPPAIFDEQEVVVPEGKWGNNKRMTLLRRVLDADGDGSPEIERYVDARSDLMIREVEDRNYDGMQDAWSDFEWGAVTLRVLDSNDDGNPDAWESYAHGRMTRREVDRDDDGVRDAFYIYEGDSLTKERHDRDNDGKIDLVMSFQARVRVKSEEDRNKDGRMDRWTVFGTSSGLELPTRIEQDSKGRGFADTFEHFRAVDGKAVLTKREEDVNGDAKIDVVSLYENGKLVRREISDPALLPEA
jgi:hypothetical protein